MTAAPRERAAGARGGQDDRGPPPIRTQAGGPFLVCGSPLRKRWLDPPSTGRALGAIGLPSSFSLEGIIPVARRCGFVRPSRIGSPDGLFPVLPGLLHRFRRERAEGGVGPHGGFERKEEGLTRGREAENDIGANRLCYRQGSLNSALVGSKVEMRKT